MIITQDFLIKQIAAQENIDIKTIQNIFKSTENIIFKYLSFTVPSENIIIKLFNGINLERKYVEKKKYSKGMFQNIECMEHVNIKSSISKYYRQKINKKLFSK